MLISSGGEHLSASSNESLGKLLRAVRTDPAIAKSRENVKDPLGNTETLVKNKLVI